MADEPEVVFDDDNPEWTEDDFANARPGLELLPQDVLTAFGKPNEKVQGIKGQAELSPSRSSRRKPGPRS